MLFLEVIIGAAVLQLALRSANQEIALLKNATSTSLSSTLSRHWRDVKRGKFTEFRQFLQYVGRICLKALMPANSENIFLLCLFLFVSVSILLRIYPTHIGFNSF